MGLIPPCSSTESMSVSTDLGSLLTFPFRMKALGTVFIVVSALCVLLTSCAQTGAPLPPSLELPKQPSDLRAGRKGNSVTLVWSEPRQTTDHESVRSLGPIRICRSSQPDITACQNPVAIVPAPPIQPKKSRRKEQPKPQAPVTFTDALPQNVLSEDTKADLTYAVEVLNRNGRGAGPSNRVHVPAIITLPAPRDLAAQLNEDGALLTWTSAGEPAIAGAQFRYRIYRRDVSTDKDESNGKKESSGTETLAGEVPVGAAGPAQFLDAIVWEKTYLYRITSVSIVVRDGKEVQIEGEDSPTIRVVAHDVFPPAVPVGLQAVYSGEGQKPFVDLIWAPVASADLAGYNVYRYNVYRGEENGAATKVNAELVKTPSYRDSAVGSGKTYTYSVSAVDVRGNESARSESASERVP